MPNIFELFYKLKEMDEDLIEFQFEDHRELLKDTQEKIDAYYDVRSRLQSEAARIATDVEALIRKQKRIENKIARIEAYLIDACKKFDIKEFKGTRVDLKLIETTRYRPRYLPDQSFYEKWPQYCSEEIDTKYSWNREKLVADFKEGKDSAREICEEYKSEYLRFKL